MRILIVGAGKVGYTIASYLSKENHDITLMDNNLSVLQSAQDSLNVICLKGSGTSMSALLEAGVDKADLMIAVTSSDEVNMLCCLTARRLGAAHTVARIRDPEYSKELNALKKDLGLDMVINPEYQTAMEIARILRFPAAVSVDPFAGGHVEMVAYRLTEEEKVVNQPLYKAMSKASQAVLFCAVQRGDEFFIPNGNTELKAGDLAYIIGRGSQIENFLKANGRKTHSVKSAMVVGGGRIAYYLCDSVSSSGMRVKIIDVDQTKCEELDEMLPDCIVIHGDGTDMELLESENIRECEALVLLTGNDEENVITGLYARQIGIKKVIVKVSRDGYSRLLKELKLDSVVSPKNITAIQIIRYVRALNNSQGAESLEMLYRFAEGHAEAAQFSVTETTKYTGVPFRKVPFKPHVLVAAIIRRSQVIIPSGTDSLQEKDTVIVVSNHFGFTELNEIFA